MQVWDIAIGKEDSQWDNGRLCGKEVIIDEVSGFSYSVSALDGHGGGAWLTDRDLEFVRHGTKEDHDEVEAKSREITAQQTNLNWIRGNWENLEKSISANSIITLLNAIGYHSSFEKNGEYFVLYDDWYALLPIYTAIMERDLNLALSHTRNVFKPDYIEERVKGVGHLYSELYN